MNQTHLTTNCKLAMLVLMATCLLILQPGPEASADSSDFEDLKATATATALDGETCLVEGRLIATSGIASTVKVGEGCELSFDTERLIDEGEQQTLTACVPTCIHRVHGRLRAEHVQIQMAQIDVEFTWAYNLSQVLGYDSPSVDTSTGGCGWHVDDGPHSWWEPNEMPSRIYRYGWALFDTSCSVTMGGWLEVAPYGTGSGGHNVVCDYSIAVPIGSSIQCTKWLVY